ncbi:unnamed protein product [Cylicocyclus nassatus]|uniref:Uncharacterized protein n=1 Tax=Cylicocyclus nassatus TaxID=53992 RepID=A0AA36GKD2_CYLNA|nr:unnamed protein product [Cylicocyclus nassatus]
MCDIGDDGERIPLRLLPWNKVTGLSFDRKKLTIVGADTTKCASMRRPKAKPGICWNCVQPCIRHCCFSRTKIIKSLLFRSYSTRKALIESRLRQIPPQLRESMKQRLLENDSLRSSGDRGQRSVSSKQRVRIKLDSNLNLKIEKMTSVKSVPLVSPAKQVTHVTILTKDIHHQRDQIQAIITSRISTTPSILPMSSDLVILEAYGIPYQGELQYSSSGGSRSDSVQHSNEMLPESMLHSYHCDQGCAHSDDADSTLRSCLPQQSSISLHDLRTADVYRMKPPPGYIDERNISSDNESNLITAPALRWCAADQQIQRLGASGQARSEPTIDSDESFQLPLKHFSGPGGCA